MSSDTVVAPPIRLLSLLFRHNDGGIDAIAFGSKATFITGASDTGKSTIVDSLRFMFGGGNAPSIPELANYQSILLVYEVEDQEVLSLEREIGKGGKALLYRGNALDGDFTGSPESLAVGKKTKGRSVTSSFLEVVGLTDLSLVWRKSPLQIRRPSMREVVDFYIIDETRITSKQPVGRANGQYTRNTLDDRLFRFLITGRDDTEYRVQSGSDASGVSRSAVFDEILDIARTRVPEGLTLEEAEPRLESVEAIIREAMEGIEGILSERSDIADTIVSVSRSLVDEVAARDELVETGARFDLLRDQYLSDLSRLEMVEEAGSLFGLLQFDTCPICGASHRDQHLDHILSSSHQAWGEAVEAEMAHTRTALSELDDTLSALREQIERLSERTAHLEREREQLMARAQLVESALAQRYDGIESLYDQRTSLGQGINALQWVASLYDERGENQAHESSPELDELSEDDVAPITARMREYLASWGVSSAETVRFDLSNRDVVLEGASRSTHGKGIRAILHAAFTLALNETTFRAPQPFVGFVILDSPIVTFADPDSDAIASGEAVEESVAQAFYRSMGDLVQGQVVVIENTEPIAVDAELTTIVAHHFTKSETHGRYGLLRRSSGG